MMINIEDRNSIKGFLDGKVSEFNALSFIENDPVSIPHMFSKKEDIEISGFLTSVISWGRRANILNSARKMMELMENRPGDFLINSTGSDKRAMTGFVYRTFNGNDLLFLIEALKNIYLYHGGLEEVFTSFYLKNGSVKEGIEGLRKILLETPHLNRSEKHIANPHKGSAAKRINMFLRWMVRNDDKGVDFGLWRRVSPADLMIPLDVHSGNIARKLGLLKRKQNDWKAVEQLTSVLKTFNNNDPVIYDYALFSLGITGFFEMKKI
jgi:uncharacterized protein (TIGR02757 family)